ncbi:MAG: UDP-N-acetylmuramoyl-tripeptide--D-alanyl-D-alanine ligase [Candidatus Aminicenantes bacterium]|jgi:UDP-N-acetylmuramoyl-tripeptide--D-alanyl-D-alanine ligase
MAEFFLNDLARKLEGHILQGSPSVKFKAFSIDSRSLSSGSLFFAIIAERNGHDFIHDAFQNGAAGAVICQDIPPIDNNFALIKVKDTTQALQILAHKTLAASDCRVVGITGSIGKTTTKEFTFRLVSENYKVLKSEGNYNNHLGLPLSLLKLTSKHEIAVLEMGMSHAGEIAALTRTAQPDVAVITNIKPVHLEFFDSIEDIALAKKEILDGTKSEGTAVLNGDDPLVQEIAKDWSGQKILFGRSGASAIRAQDIEKRGLAGMSFRFVYGKESVQVRLPFFYDTYLENFLAAAAVAYALAVPLPNLLARTQTLQPFTMRGVHHKLENGIHLIDDSYNSNPAALISALESLARFPVQRKIAVLGDMLELGNNTDEFHRQAGRAVVQNNWDVLITVGELSQKMAEGARSEGQKKKDIISFQDSGEAARNIKQFIREGDLILVKGSRGLRMEKIVKSLLSKGQ